MMLKSILLKSSFIFLFLSIIFPANSESIVPAEKANFSPFQQSVFPVSHAEKNQSKLQQLHFRFQPSFTMRGTPKYAPDFSAFDYVNPQAPKRGTLKYSAFGSFDTFNPFVLNGIPAAGIGLIYDTLMKQSDDESFSLYGLIADGVAVLPNHQGVAFHINPAAKFSDSTPIKSEDVAFTFQILKEKGAPTYRYYYQDVASVETPDSQTIIFFFKPNTQNPELPYILGELPVLPKHFWANRDFEKTSLDLPLGNGAYVVDSFVPGRSITYKRNPTYWAKDLNVNRGYYNFDTITYEYYRDTTVALEAFKAHAFDIRLENEAKKWAQFQAEKGVQSGQIKMSAFEHHLPSGMQGYVFNLRRPQFQDIRVRRALALAFDFDWMNQNLFYGLYKRTTSFFDNSYLKAPRLPTENEQQIWKKLPSSLQKSYPPLSTAQDLPMRVRLRQALDLLQEAGWHVNEKGILEKNGQPFTFEILLDSSSSTTWERVTLPFVGQLKRLGIQARIRAVDTIQYKNRLDTFDYDMIVTVWGQSLSPGNEQRYFWGSDAAQSPGSMNYSGLKDPTIDALIEQVIQADSAKTLTAATQALDRALQNAVIVIPHWHSPVTRYIYWNEFAFPERTPMKGANVMTWWKK